MQTFKTLAFNGLAPVVSLLMTAVSTAFAAELEVPALNQDMTQPASTDRKVSRPGELGIEIGALTFVGADLHLFYHLDDSPWMLGFRYLDYEDDFIAIDGDDTDVESMTVTGPFVRYLFAERSSDSWYLGGALYRTTQKIECRDSSDEDTASSLYFGGGRMGRRDSFTSYNIGLMFAPGMSLETDTGDCSSDTSGGVDGVLSLMIIFN